MLVSVWVPFQVCVKYSYRSFAGPGPLQDFPDSGPLLLRSEVDVTLWIFGGPAVMANATPLPRDMKATSPPMAASFFFTDCDPRVNVRWQKVPRRPTRAGRPQRTAVSPFDLCDRNKHL